ncbi:hypothetical protein ABN028_19670 [Actinopolymorpha sp. B17G11]|uniref:hypothetical protein n=1 Tax=Actinopolymorpha sp. B17G11 TaxID=3160861 RepID=UPI0032E39D94
MTTTTAERLLAVEVPLQSGSVAVQAERLLPGIALQPQVRGVKSERFDGHLFTGLWHLVHIPSGRLLTHTAVPKPTDLRHVASSLAAAGLNWDVPMEEITEKHRQTVVDALRPMYRRVLADLPDEGRPVDVDPFGVVIYDAGGDDW